MFVKEVNVVWSKVKDQAGVWERRWGVMSSPFTPSLFSLSLSLCLSLRLSVLPVLIEMTGMVLGKLEGATAECPPVHEDVRMKGTPLTPL